MALNRARVAADINLSTNLWYVVDVEYFDSEAPQVVLWRETFTLPLTTTDTELGDRVVERGRTVREALAQLANARTVVPAGTTVPV